MKTLIFFIFIYVWENGVLQLVSELTSPNTLWFKDELSGGWWACNTHSWRGQGSGRRCTRHDNERLPTVSRGTESHQNERDPEAV